MIRRIALVLFAATVIALPAHAGFNEVLSGLNARLGSPTWIPGFGLVRIGIRITHYDGVHDLQLATFEGKGSFDSKEADAMMRTKIGRDYVPMVRVRSKHGHEWTFIYSRPMGDLLDMVVLTNDGSDTVLVRVVVDPDTVTKYIDKDPAKVGMVARK